MSPLLLDTLVLLWWLAGDGRLDLAVAHRIKLPRHRVYVSVATAWEICALEREGHVTFERPARDCLPAEISMHRFEWLPIDHRHVFLAQQFPRTVLDPYDRLILAQASVEGLTLVTTNDRLRAPGVETMEGRTPHAIPVRPIPITTGRPPGDVPGDALDKRPIRAWNAFPWGGTVADRARTGAAWTLGYEE
jgi:PIN domain nuclease of toxin-antitoxin system